MTSRSRDADDPPKRRLIIDPTAHDDGGAELTGEEEDDVEEAKPPRVALLHEIIRRQGQEELDRNLAALAWSSLAAGLSMGFSMLARGVLHAQLQGLPGAFLIECLGYTFGFLAVILARQQLFTENTLTAVLPLMSKPSLHQLGRLMRLWSVVFAGNIVGVAVFAWGLLHLQQFDAPTHTAFRAMGEEVLHNTPWQMLTKGMLAGWVIAMMVWMLAGIEQSRVSVILISTYVIAIGGFTHIIVGSAEVLYLVFDGHASVGDYVLHFALPTLAGNIIGGSGIFALISHAQVRSDGD